MVHFKMFRSRDVARFTVEKRRRKRLGERVFLLFQRRRKDKTRLEMLMRIKYTVNKRIFKQLILSHSRGSRTLTQRKWETRVVHRVVT